MRRLGYSLTAATLVAVGLTLAGPAADADPVPPVPTPDCPGFIGPLCNLPGKIGGAVGGAIDFATNPLGYLAAAVSGAATWVMGQVALFANAATAPDLSADWWISAYRKGLAVGAVLLGFVLLYEIVQVGRRKVSSDDLMETIGIWVPAWFAGVLFGPPLAQFLINGAGYLADGIVHSMTGFGGGDAFTAISDAAATAGPVGGGATGAVQAFLALIVGIGVLSAAVLVFVSLCVQSVVVYLSTAVFAIGWVWIVSHRHRPDAWRIPRMFIGIVFGKAILFFVLGVALSIANAATAIQGDGATRDFALVIMGIVGMLLAAFTPLILLKHAPLIPGTTAAAVGASGTIAAAGAGARIAAKGASMAGSGMSKLGALAAKGAVKPGPAAVPGGASKGAPPPGGGGRMIDGPVPPSRTSTAGKDRGAAGGGRGSSPGGGPRGGSTTTTGSSNGIAPRRVSPRPAPTSSSAPPGEGAAAAPSPRPGRPNPDAHRPPAQPQPQVPRVHQASRVIRSAEPPPTPPPDEPDAPRTGRPNPLTP